MAHDWRNRFISLYRAVAACEAPEGTQVDDVLAAHQDLYNEATGRTPLHMVGITQLEQDVDTLLAAAPAMERQQSYRGGIDQIKRIDAFAQDPDTTPEHRDIALALKTRIAQHIFGLAEQPA